MRKRIAVLAWFPLLAAAWTASLHGGNIESNLSKSATIQRIVATGTADNKVMDHLAHLTKDIGARPAGSEEHQAASEWALAKFKEFGLANAHLEECGVVPKIVGPGGISGLFGRLFHRSKPRLSDREMVKVYNVVADIRGVEKPDEYVIVGAHIDSVPIAEGAADNGVGVAAVMEAARILSESGAKPKRTIRFILFAGEESGLVGSRGYVDAHPDLLPKISAMYNMDYGSNYISKVVATEPLLADMEQILAPAMCLDPAMPLRIEQVDYLPKVDPRCCQNLAEGGAVPFSPGPTDRVIRRKADGSFEQADLDLLKGLGIPLDDIAGRDSLRLRMGGPGGCGSDKGVGLGCGDLGKLGIKPQVIRSEVASPDGRKVLRVAMAGSSDVAAFLTAGVPSFWWGQDGDSTVVYPAHSERDTYENTVPKYIKHSALVVALAALGTADLDHMLSRERLTEPEDTAGSAAPSGDEAEPKERRKPEGACCPGSSI